MQLSVMESNILKSQKGSFIFFLFEMNGSYVIYNPNSYQDIAFSLLLPLI